MKNTKFSATASAVIILIAMTGCASLENASGNLKKNILNMPDEGIGNLEAATKKAPTNAEYKVDYLLSRDDRIRDLLKEADALRKNGGLEKAGELYGKVLQLDPANPRASAGIIALKQDARTLQMLENGEYLLAQEKYEQALRVSRDILEDHPQSVRANSLQDAALDAMAKLAASKAKERAAKAIFDSPVTLQFSDASIKTVFEAISKSSGINVLFDKDVKQDAKVTIFLKGVSVSEALDLLLMQNQLRTKTMGANTLLVYPSSAAKIEEYEEMIVKTVQITNADIKYLSGMLKSMLKIREISADEKTGLMVMRDRPEMLRLADRLIASHDVPEPEIMLEVEVLEVSTARDSNLGVKPPGSIGFSTPGAASAGGTGTGAAASGAITLNQLRNLTSGDLLVTPLNTTINFKLDDSDAKILASPRIRARNKEQAKIMIGDRVPTITNTVTPVNTGSSVVTGNVTYQDVGLKLEFEPQVYANSEVGIKITLEVSSIAKEFTDNNGGRSYQIGTRNAKTNLRLKDGETQILGGLITDEDRNAASKIPGLGHLPFVGRIFGNNAGTSTRSEIILAITPRIVRNLAAPPSDVRNIYSGTYNSISERPILSDNMAQISTPGSFQSSSTTSAGGAGVSGGQPAGAGGPSGVFVNPAPKAQPAPATDSFQRTPAPTPGAPMQQPQGLPPAPPRIIR